jgi:hypothetical protein
MLILESLNSCILHFKTNGHGLVILPILVYHPSVHLLAYINCEIITKLGGKNLEIFK